MGRNKKTIAGNNPVTSLFSAETGKRSVFEGNGKDSFKTMAGFF